MTDITERPISKDEVFELLKGDYTFATGKIDDERFIIRNEQSRREYYVRAEALRYMLKNTQWTDPSEDAPDFPEQKLRNALQLIADTPVTMANDSESLRDTIKHMQWLATAALKK